LAISALKGGSMGKIFGISDNPVSTIESALRGQYSVEPPFPREIARNKEIPADKFVKKGKKTLSNPIIKMRNLVRKMLSHLK
jgi:hypothetical protein